MPRTLTVCAVPDCPNVAQRGQSRCDDCRHAAEAARGTASQRGYGQQHRRRFRRGVLARDPICVICQRRPATHADHWPLSRRELVARGLDPNDPRHGRGLCAPCDSTQTAQRQPGGWHAAQ